MTVRRIIRNRHLSPEESKKLRTIRAPVANELPELVARHHGRATAEEQLKQLLAELKQMREEKGVSLTDLMQRTGMDRSALSKLETGQRPNPTVETLERYAEAFGKRIVMSLADA